MEPFDCTCWTGNITSTNTPVGQEMLTLSEHLVHRNYYLYQYTCWTGNITSTNTPVGQEMLTHPEHLVNENTNSSETSDAAAGFY